MKDYYSINAKEYIDSTFNCNMHSNYKIVEDFFSNAKNILDLGCGSCRDALYFKSKGYNVSVLDPTLEFCEHAKKLGFESIYNLRAEKMNFTNEFDVIWACASLLHVSSNDLEDVFVRCFKALKNSGIMYASFKYGDFEGIRDGRRYLDLNENTIKKYILKSGLLCVKTIITTDVRENNSTKWLNVILSKK